MRVVSAVVLVVFFTPLAAAPVPKANLEAAKELAKLDGTWEVTSLTIGGVELVKQLPEKMIITFKDGAFTWSTNEQPGKIVSIDPNKKPKEIDYLYTEGPNKGKAQKAIYMLDGDTYTDCFGEVGNDSRPGEFKSTRDNDLTVMVYKRVKKKE
jgi:uncharacterized protein (TIGR03067 family)